MWEIMNPLEWHWVSQLFFALGIALIVIGLLFSRPMLRLYYKVAYKFWNEWPWW